MFDLLLIEDDDVVRSELAHALRDEGHTVSEAATGGHGLLAFDTDRPDLVLLDVRLPDMSGFDVCRQLRTGGTVPIIMVTAPRRHPRRRRRARGRSRRLPDQARSLPRSSSARIRALLRRASTSTESGWPVERIRVGELDDAARRRAWS